MERWKTMIIGYVKYSDPSTFVEDGNIPVIKTYDRTYKVHITIICFSYINPVLFGME